MKAFDRWIITHTHYTVYTLTLYMALFKVQETHHLTLSMSITSVYEVNDQMGVISSGSLMILLQSVFFWWVLHLLHKIDTATGNINECGQKICTPLQNY